MAPTNIQLFKHIKRHCVALCGRWQREASCRVLARDS